MYGPKGLLGEQGMPAPAGLEVRALELLVLKMSLKLFLVLKYLVILMYFTVFKTCENMQGDNKLNIQMFSWVVFYIWQGFI